jgi:hypothetical protein
MAALSIRFCPFLPSLLLGETGCTSIPKEEDEKLKATWRNHPLWPITGEQETAISGGNGEINAYHRFCPEIAYDVFHLFATSLARHVDEIDRDMAAERLTKEGASHDDPRWVWSGIAAQHYSECPLFSSLSHDWLKLLARPAATLGSVSAAPAARFDVFISHASEDKDEFVRPLAGTLTSMGLKVWFDEWTLTLGDSLLQKIDEGLGASDYGVVILSSNFFAKKWPRAELDGLYAREMMGRKVILPIWHNVTREEVLNYSPILASKLAAPTDEGVEAVANKIFGVIRSTTSAPFNPATVTSIPSPQKRKNLNSGKFSVELGKRHRHVREKILGINPRRMADFYGFEKAAQLETCERGDDEFPTNVIKKLRDFFFVSREYLEGEHDQVFDSRKDIFELCRLLAAS